MGRKIERLGKGGKPGDIIRSQRDGSTSWGVKQVFGIVATTHTEPPVRVTTMVVPTAVLSRKKKMLQWTLLRRTRNAFHPSAGESVG